MTVREKIIKIVNENTLLGEFKAVPVTDQILQAIEEAVPEEAVMGDFTNFTVTLSVDATAGIFTAGYNAAREDFKKILRS